MCIEADSYMSMFVENLIVSFIIYSLPIFQSRIIMKVKFDKLCFCLIMWILGLEAA